jgi:hypothetical protein
VGVHDGNHREERKDEHPSWKDQHPGTSGTVSALEKSDKAALEAGNLAFI